MSKQHLSTELISILEESINDSLDNYIVDTDNESVTGNGFLGEMVVVNLIKRSSNDITKLVVKQAVPSAVISRDLIENSYFNEIHFYNKVWKEFQKFQDSFIDVKKFDNVPKCLAVSSEKNNEKIVMENLIASGYKMFPRQNPFDDKYANFMFTVYGRFHGLSAAFREHNQERFEELTSALKNSSVNGLDAAKKYLALVIGGLIDMVGDKNIQEKLKVYQEKGVELAKKSLKYHGKNPVFNHGDCWSNNFMFKYDENGNILDVKLVDFQMCRKGSVVYDLSYFLYSGVKKDILDNLDYYLKIYHDSFSNTLSSYNLDPASIFTFEDLKEEFKEYFAFGFIMSQLVWPIKLSGHAKPTELLKDEDRHEKQPKSMGNDEVKDIYIGIAEHLYQNKYL